MTINDLVFCPICELSHPMGEVHACKAKLFSERIEFDELGLPKIIGATHISSSPITCSRCGKMISPDEVHDCVNPETGEIHKAVSVSSESGSMSACSQYTGDEGWKCCGCGSFVPWNESHQCPSSPTYTYPASDSSHWLIIAELKRIADALEKIEKKMK